MSKDKSPVTQSLLTCFSYQAKSFFESSLCFSVMHSLLSFFLTLMNLVKTLSLKSPLDVNAFISFTRKCPSVVFANLQILSDVLSFQRMFVFLSPPNESYIEIIFKKFLFLFIESCNYLIIRYITYITLFNQDL